MPQLRSILGATLILVMGLSQAAANDPKTLICDFKVGSAHTYEKGGFKAEKAGAVTFRLAAIDPVRQTAEIASPRGSNGVRVVRAINALHFIEIVGEGFMNVTTVYDLDQARKAHPAVHSRHFGLLGQPIVSQYRGYCVPG